MRMHEVGKGRGRNIRNHQRAVFRLGDLFQRKPGGQRPRAPLRRESRVGSRFCENAFGQFQCTRPHHSGIRRDRPAGVVHRCKRYRAYLPAPTCGLFRGGRITSEMAVMDSHRIGRIIFVDGLGIQVDGRQIPDVFPISQADLLTAYFYNLAAFAAVIQTVQTIGLENAGNQFLP